jgi:hypothetical protein
VAATLAAVALVALGVVGYTSTPSEPRDEQVANLGTEASPEASAEPSPESSPTPAGTRTPKENAIAFTNGIKLQVVASRADCWVDVTADGVGVYAQVLTVGQRTASFSADTSMDVVLGNAYGVDLVVNGHKLTGPFGASGDVVTISLPEDIKTLL